MVLRRTREEIREEGGIADLVKLGNKPARERHLIPREEFPCYVLELGGYVTGSENVLYFLVISPRSPRTGPHDEVLPESRPNGVLSAILLPHNPKRKRSVTIFSECGAPDPRESRSFCPVRWLEYAWQP